MALLRSPFLWFVLFFACAEVAAWSWHHRQPIDLDDYRRNATPLRNWPAYTACNRDSERPLAVLIGNSQAVGPEFSDGDQIYVSMLKERLARDGIDVDLRNWSVNGLRTNQLELLSLKAIRCGARALIFVLSMPNITEMNDYRLDTHSADVEHIAGEPGIWLYLPGSLILERAEPNELIMAAIRRHLSLFTLREAVLDRAASVLDRRDFYTLTGHMRQPFSHLSLAERAERSGRERVNIGFGVGETVHQEHWRRQIERERMPVFEHVYDNLNRQLKAHDVQLAWIWSATSAEGTELELLEVSEEFQQRICERVRRDGWPCHDLTHAMPRDNFFSAGIGSHFNRQGQLGFADLVYPIVSDAVH